MNICKKCGRQLNKNALFCPKCGTKTEPPLSFIKKVSKSISKIFIKHKKKIKFSTILVISGIFLYCGSNFAIKYYYRSLSDFTNSIGTKFILVKKGSFQMGSNSGESAEEPIHTVNITKDFYVGKYEVTQGEWERVMGYNPSAFRSCGANCPVEWVSWDDVQTFIKKLNKMEGTNKYRLLTEAEWEYAARGGNNSKGYKYSGSNSIGDVAWYGYNSGRETNKVGLKKPNELGIYDMSGNVGEWVQDRYDNNYYSKSPTNNPLNSSGSEFVIRGGNWRFASDYCSVTNRDSLRPGSGNLFIGFRLAKSLSIQSDKTSLDFSSENTKSVSFNLINDYPTGAVVQKIEIPSNFSLTGLSVNDTLSANSTKSVTCTYNGNGFPSTNSFIKIYFEDDIVTSIIIEKPIEFVLVEKGSFQMGSNSGRGYEKPVHTVNITKDFYVGKYEVTNEQVVQVYNWAKSNNISNLTFSSSSVKYNGKELLDLDDSGCEIGYRNGSLYVKDSKDNYPCIEITWYGAEAFCKFLNKQNRTDEYRLLTEAEWEYASRGGNKSKGYTYSGSNNVDEVAEYSGNNDKSTKPVGGKKPNELGLYDMSGNAWEWVQDRYDNNYYSKSPMNNPLNDSGSYFVLRGGCWSNSSNGCRVANRFDLSPDYSLYSVGFRFAKTL